MLGRETVVDMIRGDIGRRRQARDIVAMAFDASEYVAAAMQVEQDPVARRASGGDLLDREPGEFKVFDRTARGHGHGAHLGVKRRPCFLKRHLRPLFQAGFAHLPECFEFGRSLRHQYASRGSSLHGEFQRIPREIKPPRPTTAGLTRRHAPAGGARGRLGVARVKPLLIAAQMSMLAGAIRMAAPSGPGTKRGNVR